MGAAKLKHWISRATGRDDGLRTMTVRLPKDRDADLSRFATQLYQAHNRIFAGVDEPGFVRYLFHSGADASRIRAYLTPDGRMVGYAAAHRYGRDVSGRRIVVFRAEAGLLPQYRAHGRTFWFFTRELLKYRLLHPAEPIFYLGMLVHPSSYVVFARYFRDVYPHREHAVPGPAQRMMQDLADSFGVPPVDAADPLLRLVGWRTRRAKPYWEQTDDPDVAYFRERNPGYRHGHGLVVLVPITLRNLVHAVVSYVHTHLRRHLFV